MQSIKNLKVRVFMLYIGALWHMIALEFRAMIQ